MKRETKGLITKIGIVGVVVGAIIGFGSCGNRQIFDTTYKYDRALIYLQNYEIIEVKVDKWTDYEGEQVQITDTDGNVYLVNSMNCTLIKDGKKENKKTFVQFDEFGRVE